MDSIADLQYYLKAALPFGAPVNTNYSLLRRIRSEGFSSHHSNGKTSSNPMNSAFLLTTKQDQDADEALSVKAPAWKPYLYKGAKAKLMLSVVGFRTEREKRRHS